MKILHTSDWHLGRSLYSKKRYREFSLFLDWLGDLIEEEGIDILLMAGDVFDTTTPGSQAQELYYRFLHRLAASPCRHGVIIAGNHDSPSFLSAPQKLLRALNIHVIGGAEEDLNKEVLLLSDKDGNPQVLVCGVPYLRDKDIRRVEPGETLEDKEAKLIAGLKNHYQETGILAQAKQAALEKDGGPKVPIIAMGHLFTAGGKTVDGDGVRELYAGSLAHAGKEVFPSCIDYLALGHLHVPQSVGDTPHFRYSGSPLPMGFGEAGQEKKVLILQFHNGLPVIQERLIPCFQPLERISGSLEDIQKQLEEKKREQSPAWLEIEYTGTEPVPSLRGILQEDIQGSSMEILRVKNKQVMDRVIHSAEEEETLDDLDETDVFQRCLDAFKIPPDERTGLTGAYNEILQALREEDPAAEEKGAHEDP